MSKLPTREQVRQWSAVAHVHTQSCYGRYEPCGEHHVHDEECGMRPLRCHYQETPGLCEVCDGAAAALDIAALLSVPPDGDVVGAVTQLEANLAQAKRDQRGLSGNSIREVELCLMKHHLAPTRPADQTTAVQVIDKLVADLAAERERTARAVAMYDELRNLFEDDEMPDESEIGALHVVEENSSGYLEYTSKRTAEYLGSGRWAVGGGTTLWHELGGAVRSWRDTAESLQERARAALDEPKEPK